MSEKKSSSLETLIPAARSGDQAALSELLASHLPAIRAYVRLNVNEALRACESSSDLVQSVCREVLTGLDGFEYRGKRSFHNWLFVMVLNKLRDKSRFYLRQKRAAVREAEQADLASSAEELVNLYASVASPSQVAVARETVERIEAAFEKLPEKYREILTKSRLIGMTNAEIAEETRQTRSAVSTQVARGLVMLSKLLDEESPNRRETP